MLLAITFDILISFSSKLHAIIVPLVISLDMYKCSFEKKVVYPNYYVMWIISS